MKAHMLCEVYSRFVLNPFAGAKGEMRLTMRIAAVLLAVLASSRAAHAAAVVVNVPMNDLDFENGSTFNPYTGQGALNTGGTHDWNVYPFTEPQPFTGLVDSSGAPSSVTVAANGDGYTPGATLDTGNFLLDGSLSAGPGTGISGAFTIGGLAPNSTYDLYLYGWNQAGSPSAPVPFGTTFNITSGGTNGNPNPQSTSGAALTSGTDYTSSSISNSALGKAYVNYHNLISNSSGEITGTCRVHSKPFPSLLR